LPEGVDPAAAASVADNVSDAYRHVGPHLPRLLADDADTGVLIVAGVGRHPVDPPSIALYAGLIARTLGARTVRLADRRPYVRDHAARLGLEPLTAAELRRIAPAALVVDVSGTGALAAALRSTAPDGVCSSAGGRRPTARLPVARMYASNATLHLGRTHARAVIPDVLRLITEHDLQPQRVTTTVARLDNAPGAIHRHVTSQDVKTVLIG
jgi:alcohol dehydrogenase